MRRLDKPASAFRRARVLLLLLPLFLSFASLSGCGLINDLLGQEGQTPPTVEASQLQLRRRPTVMQLAAYYCPQVIDDAIVRASCFVILGSPPPSTALIFEFGVSINIKNPNNVPVPALDVLLALTLFQGQGAEAVGAVCLSMCGAQDPTCNGQPKPGACESSQNDIRTLDDFQARIPGLISDVISGQAIDELRKSTIPAAGDVRLDLGFQLGIDQALRVFQKTAVVYVQDLLAGRQAALSVPVTATGTVFFNLPVLGRFGVGYGPLTTTWNIDSTVLN